MAQLPFPGMSGSRKAGSLRAIHDYGLVGRGASAPRYVLAENNSEYIIKGPSLSPGNRYVAANEFLAAELAGLLALPILDHRVIEMNGELFFGSSWMQHGSFYPATTQDLFDRCENRERVYDLVVFDTWVCNVDRHEQNLVVRCSGSRAAGDHHTLLLNDHSHCLVTPGRSPSQLPPLLDSPPDSYVRLAFVRESIVDSWLLAAALDRVEALNEDVVRSVVRTVPEPFLPQSEQVLVEQFLVDRRSRLREVFRSGSPSFPNLQGGHL